MFVYKTALTYGHLSHETMQIFFENLLQGDWISYLFYFNTLFQEGDTNSYKLFLLAALIITTTTICTIYTKSHSHEYSNKIRNSQYIYDNYKFVVRFDLICLTRRFLNEDFILADLTAVGNLLQI